MEIDDVGGGWILVTPASDSCPVTPPPTPTETTTTNQIPLIAGLGLGALLIGIMVGRMTKRSNQ